MLTYHQLEDTWVWANEMVAFTDRDRKLIDTVMLLATECYELKMKQQKKNKKQGARKDVRKGY